MTSDYPGHDRPKPKKPKYFHDTFFSYIAFWLALLMIVPISGRISFVPDARADGANGVCEFICPPPDGSIQVCNSDPNDPDCNLTINTTCLCNDGSTFTITGVPSADTCNTDATCNDHGGWAASGGQCLCHDGYSFDIPFTPSSAACSPDPPTSPSCFDHGGWVGDPITIGGCAELEIFTRCTADAFVHDPATGATLVNEQLSAGEALDHLETQAIAEVIALHGLSTSTAERERVLTWARDRVRAQIFAKLVDIIATPVGERTTEEQTLYDWLTIIVWQKRIEPAQKAWEQFQGWQNAVEFATCSWQPPNSVYWQPKWRTPANDPQLVSCQADVNIGGQMVQRLCQINGCSSGNDGIPRTDPTPNAAGSPPNPNDDGEICFASGAFTYDQCTISRCAGTPALPGCSVAIPAHPTYEQFKGYGATLARKNFVYQPSFLSIAANTSKAASFGVAIGVAVAVAGAVTGVAAGSGGLAAFSAAIFPFAAKAGAIAGFAGLALFATVLIVVLAVLTAILAGFSVAEFAQLPGQLQTDVRTAASTTNTAQGKPNLATLITTNAGKQEIYLAFIETVGPEIDLSGRTAPAPENKPLWAVMDQNRTPLPSESGQLLNLTSWPDDEGNDTFLQAGLYNGWFVAKLPLTGGGTNNVLTLGIEYMTPTGEKWTAWRTKCQDETDTACTFGQALFVHTRNGDEPILDLSEEDFAAWFANASTEITYKNSNGQTRIAYLYTGPVVAGFQSIGDLKEGSQLSLSASSTPSGAALAWDFDDGSTGEGSPVLHTFADNGTFDLQVAATDSFGLTGAASTFPLAIANVPPTATFSVTTQLVRGESSTLTFTNPTDPSSVDTAAGFKHSFDCTNDGTLEVSGSATPSHACRYATAGVFTAKGVIADKDLGSTPYTAQITVASLQQTAEPLRTQLQALRTQKVLKKKELEFLLNDRLTYTIERLDTLVDTAKGREAATTALNEFLANVNTFVSQGILTATQGQTLRDTATRLLAVVASFAA